MLPASKKIDCPACNTPDVELTPGVGGELWGECPNCEASSTEYDREYMVHDSNDSSEKGLDAAESNRKRGFFW